MCSLDYNEHISKLLSLMPNHCSNRVSFYSDDTTVILRLHEIFSRALDENDTRSVFGEFIPEPVCQAIREQFDDLCVSWFYDEPGCEVAGYL